MRARPDRIDRLPSQYFTSLLARVAAVAARGRRAARGSRPRQPDVPPPAHVIEALAASAREPTPAVHGYAPFAGLPELREAIAERYAAEYGVELDPEREVALLPGTKTALIEVALCVAESGDRIALPDPGYPDYNSAVALAGARASRAPARRGGPPRAGRARRHARAVLALPELPVEPRAAAAPDGVFGEAVAFARGTGAAVMHDFAYGDLVYDGRAPAELPRRARRPRGRSRALLLLEELRHGRLAARLRARERRAGRARHLAPGARAGRDLRRAPAGRDRGAARARRRRSPSGARCTRRGAPASSRPSARSSPAVRERSSSGCVCRRARRPSSSSSSTASPSRRARASASAAAATSRLSLATSDAALDLGLDRLRRALLGE